MNYQNNKTETSVIQLALKRAGFLDGEIDGIFGSDTRNAVIAFQKAASLFARRNCRSENIRRTFTVSQRVHDSPCKKGRFALFDCRHTQHKHKKNYACKSDG